MTAHLELEGLKSAFKRPKICFFNHMYQIIIDAKRLLISVAFNSDVSFLDSRHVHPLDLYISHVYNAFGSITNAGA